MLVYRLGNKLEMDLTNKFISYLGCTDVAPDPTHPRLTRRDAATREGRRRLSVRVTLCHVDFSTRADAAQIRPTRAVSAETTEMAGSSRNGRVRPKFKKKKKVQNAPFELNLNT